MARESTAKAVNEKDAPVETPASDELDHTATRSLDAQGRIKEPQQEGTVRFQPTHATVRIIRVNEWPHDARHEDDDKKVDAVWDQSNGWELPTDMFTARQLQVLEQDGSFTVVK